ncbi:MAG: hydroxymethylglutaryl-CoA reductase [Deltaproteobacteria bacterium]|nr:hydroxymethylglutaryl-CoA reductase [Deltaproteobacteria bacterium]
MEIPALILKQLYAMGSLMNVDEGVRFGIKNPLADATLTGVSRVEINGKEVPLDRVVAKMNGTTIRATEVDEKNLIPFPLGQVIDVYAHIDSLEKDKQHSISIAFDTEPFGSLNLEVEDMISEETAERIAIPSDRARNYQPEIVRKRQEFIQEYSGVHLEHLDKYSFDPSLTQGNIENFTGVAQVPVGFAGPIRINGEHAQGDFIIPLATTEGTLVASYNRGMKVINLCGGIKTTISDDRMQRAPVFVFDSAREARTFAHWIDDAFDDIAKQAESTSSVARLINIQKFLASKFVYLRFNFTTGDAAGQNMVNHATFAACNWIVNHYQGIRHYYLEANFATDKKASQVNIMHTRGKRVTAEITIDREVLIQHMRVDPETLCRHSNIANVGAFMAGVNNNGLHSTNAITALFIATGQDVANVSECSAGMLYTEVTPEGDLYGSITIPSLIVATHGGGTGLPTQRECLEILGCHGKGKVRKFAEIVAAVVGAGELSLAAAISSLDWVWSHERYGRNR